MCLFDEAMEGDRQISIPNNDFPKWLILTDVNQSSGCEEENMMKRLSYGNTTIRRRREDLLKGEIFGGTCLSGQ